MSNNLLIIGETRTWTISTIEDQKSTIKQQLSSHGVKLSDSSAPEIAQVVYHRDKQFEKLKEKSDYTVDSIRKTLLLTELPTDKRPIIHISETDLFNNEQYIENVPRYIKFFRSSIWHYYLPLYTLTNKQGACCRFKKNDVEKLLISICEDIRLNKDQKRYELQVAKEYNELHNRLLDNSHLLDNAHGSYVAPFVFHSEDEVSGLLNKQLADANILDKSGNVVTDLNPMALRSKMRILLVDDHANTPMAVSRQENKVYVYYEYKPEESTILCPLGKLKIVIDNIYSIFPNINIAWCYPSPDEIKNLEEGNTLSMQWNYCGKEGEFDIAITCTRSIDDAKAILKHSKVEIVLLDYLLDYNKNKGCREYSYELLKYIYDNKSEKEYIYKENESDKKERNEKYIPKGPLGKFYFMYISAFSSAIAERLQEQRLIYNTKYWHIGKGACPTNTPKLFLFYLFSLIERRYNDMLFDEEYNIEGHTLIDLLKALFKDGNKHVKLHSTRYFNALLSLRSKYDKMKSDTDPKEFSDKKDLINRRGSLLVYSLFPDIQHYSNSFWEHIQHLVYLFANGTMRQWPDMYEEYIFVRERLIEAENTLKVNNDNERPSHLIEQYIIHLKNA